jgi:hypothetical protein
MSQDNAETTEITATIIPSKRRGEESKDELQAFIRHLNDFQELPSVIEGVGELMGLKGYGAVQSGPAFGQDVLRIKVRGNTGLNLTIVNLSAYYVVDMDCTDARVWVLQASLIASQHCVDRFCWLCASA